MAARKLRRTDQRPSLPRRTNGARRALTPWALTPWGHRSRQRGRRPNLAASELQPMAVATLALCRLHPYRRVPRKGGSRPTTATRKVRARPSASSPPPSFRWLRKPRAMPTRARTQRRRIHRVQRRRLRCTILQQGAGALTSVRVGLESQTKRPRFAALFGKGTRILSVRAFHLCPSVVWCRRRLLYFASTAVPGDIQVEILP